MFGRIFVWFIRTDPQCIWLVGEEMGEKVGEISNFQRSYVKKLLFCAVLFRDVLGKWLQLTVQLTNQIIQEAMLLSLGDRFFSAVGI